MIIIQVNEEETAKQSTDVIVYWSSEPGSPGPRNGVSGRPRKELDASRRVMYTSSMSALVFNDAEHR